MLVRTQEISKKYIRDPKSETDTWPVFILCFCTLDCLLHFYPSLMLVNNTVFTIEQTQKTLIKTCFSNVACTLIFLS